MSAWHRPDVETAALEHLTAATGSAQSAWQILNGVRMKAAAKQAARVTELEAEVERLRAERDAFADRVDTLTAVAKSNKRHVQAMGAELPAAESRGRALGHVAGLREAAEMVDVDDDCGCGGCDSCTSRQDAARIRAHADLLTAALGGIAGGGR